MGLSASQARLLNLTSRMHDIEYKAQKLEAQKLQMANESTQVYKEYEDALNMVKVQQKQIANDGSASFTDASYTSLREAGYLMSYVRNGQSYLIVTQAEADAFQNSFSALDFAAKMCDSITVPNKNAINHDTDYRLVSTAEEFIKAATTAGLDGIMLMNDIDFSSIQPTISDGCCYYIDGGDSFMCDIDGNGYSIKGLKASLFKSVCASGLANVKMEVDINSDASKIGALAAYAHGAGSGAHGSGVLVQNVVLSGSITSTAEDSKVGAMVGSVDETGYSSGVGMVFSNITNSVNLSGNESEEDAKYLVGDGGVFGINNVLNTGTFSQNGGTPTPCASTDNATGAELRNRFSIENTPEVAKYVETYNKMKSGYLIDGSTGDDVIEDQYKNSTVWLSNLLQNGDLLLSKLDSTTLSYYDVNVATDTALQEVSDETALKKAEAKYEADMRKINQKDTKFDTELAAMETERNAVKTEMDTLKGVAKDNVDRTFKLFG